MTKDNKTTSRVRRFLVVGAVALIIVVLGLVGVVVALVASVHKDQPSGTPGPRAEALADRMTDATEVEKWSSIEAVSFDFDGRRSHLWDRRRHCAQVSYPDGLVVLIDLRGDGGSATRAGTELDGADAADAIESARSHHVNDVFWLDPVATVHNPETTRAAVDWEGEEALLVTYGDGGQTPGDSYLWKLGPDGRPQTWWMWVSILPVGGLSATWEGWQRLGDNGPWVSTRHETVAGALEMKDIQVGTVKELAGGKDPFAALASQREPEAAPASTRAVDADE